MGTEAKHRKAKKELAPVDGAKPGAQTRCSPGVPVLSPESDPQSVEEHLLHPGNLKGFRHLRAGGKITPSGNEAVRIQWSPETSQRIISFLQTGDMEQLATLLRESPFVIAHPVVFQQVLHLRWLRRLPDEGDLEKGSSSSSEYVPPAGTREEARKALQKLTTAWVQGVLGGSWTLKPPPKRRGRKVSPDDISFNDWLLDQYEEVLIRLKQEQVRRLRGESKHQWMARLCDIIRQTWTSTSISEKDEVHVPPGVDPMDLSKIVVKSKSLPLSENSIKSWAGEAIQLAAEGPIRDRIAHHLLAYRWDLKANQVRWGIQAARKFKKTTK